MENNKIFNWLKVNKFWFWSGLCTLISGMLQFLAKLYPEKIKENMQSILTTSLWVIMIISAVITIIKYLKLKIEQSNDKLILANNETNAMLKIANNHIAEANNQIDSLRRLLEITMKQSSMTSRLLQYNIIFYLRSRDDNFMQYFSEQMYRMRINVDELKEYQLDRLFEDHYKAFVHSQAFDAVLNNNPIVKNDFLRTTKEDEKQ